ncbi:MAG: hypothetical protein D4R64_02415 [Porphyromonadaceae bacterium]|nr:MAG: hypothetical protein D4R64_02415 [Porphyromonadaceae bacterium]
MPFALKPGLTAEGRWLPLDNAAKIFPAGTNKTRTLVFRIIADIDRPVKFSTLTEATRLTSLRYPYLTMHLRKGFFWYWLDEDSEDIPVFHDFGEPCKSFRFTWSQEPLCRVFAGENRISVEFYHVITDGSGALEFFKTLIAAYAELEGITFPQSGFNHYTSEPHPEETEDGYIRYFDPRVISPPKLSKAYHVPFALIGNPRVRILHCETDANLIKEKAKSLGITITEYFVSIYLWSLQDIYHRVKNNRSLYRRPVIRIQVPVNLRNLFPSKTLRNFSLFVTPEIDMRLGFYTFQEITHSVHHYMQQQTDPKLMKKIIYRNVNSERKLLIRIIPLILKDRVLSYYFKRSGMALYSGLVTNMGRITFDGEFPRFIQRFRLIPPPPDQCKIVLALVTYNDKMVLTFSNTTVLRQLEKTFLEFLRDDGITIKILNP